MGGSWLEFMLLDMACILDTSSGREMDGLCCCAMVTPGF